jgi:dGTPase
MREQAPYACVAQTSRGRRHAEPGPHMRTEYQRDRDRVLHSGAFRRLEYKTQVFVNHEGDMFRTRLTHSLEVAQIARSASRTLGLDEDLTEAICLAHDLGHTPFGHAGQYALNRCMNDYGGFEHNLQSLRVVDALEERYPDFAGLNLTFESREGVLKHCSSERARGLGDVGERFLDRTQPSLEAQLANVCDEIAYNHHDVDDGLRAGLISISDLLEVETFAKPFAQVRQLWPALTERRVVYEVIRRMIDRSVVDLVTTTQARLEDAKPGDVHAVRTQPDPLVGFSDPLAKEHAQLKRFLHARLYRHHRVHRMTVKAQGVIGRLFDAFLGDDDVLPEQARARAQAAPNERRRARAIADYIAGMTDRFALAEYERLFNPMALG